MKKNFFPMALMAIAMGLNACSSDDPVVNTGGGKAPFADGGYVKMAINMPSAPSSRAANDDFVNSDGLAKEYEVKNATLILFEGDDDENNAVFHSAYDLPVSMTKDGDTQITSTTKIVKKVENSVPNTQLYAYVVLNDNGLLDVANSKINVPSSATATTLVGMKFSDFKNTVVSGGADKFKNDGFLMDNAPLLNKTSSTSTITSLVNISGKVYRSKAEAEAKPATEIFVERALAKVTVADKTGTTKKLQGDGVKTITGPTSAVSPDVNYTIEGWTLDVTNKSSYLGRNFNSAWKDITESESTTATPRFVGTSPLRTTTDLFRTYWAEDPNYGGASYTFSSGAFNYLGNGDGNLVNQKLDESTPLYCMENTFDVANQRVQQTTRAIVKVKIGTAGTFYTFNGDNSMLYDKTNMEKRVLDAIKSSTAVMGKMSTSTQTVTKIEDADIKDLKLGWVKTGEGTSTTLENECDGDGKIYVLSFSVKKADGTWIPIDNNTFTDKTLVDVLQLREIMMYKEGYAYYPVLIKHFGDDLTPWNKTTASFDNPYGDPVSNKYLGRYGVVRNNWYNIDIKSINNVGSAVVPNASKNASFDDKPENYISVRINVLSWAKRNQEEHL